MSCPVWVPGLNFSPLEEQQVLSHLSSLLGTFCKQGRKGVQEWLKQKEQLVASKPVCSTLRHMSS